MQNKKPDRWSLGKSSTDESNFQRKLDLIQNVYEQYGQLVVGGSVGLYLLNLIPLRSFKDVDFIVTPQQLEQIQTLLQGQNIRTIDLKDYEGEDSPLGCIVPTRSFDLLVGNTINATIVQINGLIVKVANPYTTIQARLTYKKQPHAVETINVMKKLGIKIPISTFKTLYKFDT